MDQRLWTGRLRMGAGVVAGAAIAVCAAGMLGVSGDAASSGDDLPTSDGASVDAAIGPDGRLARVIELPATPQAPGDAQRGRDYLLYGDYIGSGIPTRLFETIRRLNGGGEPGPSPLEREGAAATLPPGLNAFTMPSGVEVVAGANCLACHGSMFRGEFVVGMGNSLADWTGRDPLPAGVLRGAARMLFGQRSAEARALDQFLRGAGVLTGRADAPFRGVVPAFRIEELAAAHRVPGDLSWSDEPLWDVLPETIASDPPPLWNVDKKHALYSTGLGRGDFAKLIQQITVVGIGDDRDAERINAGMTDLLAYLKTLEPPAYPEPIDRDLAARGAQVFAESCMSCHGSYDVDATYPNKLVPVEVVGTDPVYAEALRESHLWRWFNESWFATTEPRAWALPAIGYVAPPLDGVWATAPYLHNGSVPTLAALLESSTRPTRWRRSFDHRDYDLDRLGWNYEPVPAGGELLPTGERDPHVYDTTLRGYGNQGHTFGDELTDAERRALIEYLKTL